MATHQARAIFRETTALQRQRLQPGVRECLCCDRKFNSWHVVKNRICPACRRAWADEPQEEVYTIAL